VVALSRQGKSLREIQEATGISRTKAQRLLDQAKQQGRLLNDR
jgi:DNA-binding transcriptional regulator LsrR (DeoR family)